MKQVILYKDLKCEFDDAKHQLFVNGERNPFNITGVTGLLDKSQPLIYWAVGLTRDFLNDVLSRGETITAEHISQAVQQHRAVKEKTASIGDMVHEYAELFSLGLKPELPEDERAKNGVLAFLRWLGDSKIKIKNPEQILLSKKYGYWGIADSDGTKGKELYNVEYKTSKGIYSDHRYQAAAQLKAKEEMTRKKYKGSYLLHFNKETGEFASIFIDEKETKKDFKAFLGLFAAKKRETELKNGK